MAARLQRAWVRAAALGVLAAWLPCMPIGLCVRAATQQVSSHGCCPRQPPVKMAAAPRECWRQAPAPLPAGPPPPAPRASAAVATVAQPVTGLVAAHGRPPTSFSPLAVVLRI